jgi:hypothetical protein
VAETVLLHETPSAVSSARYDPGMTELDLLVKVIAEDLCDPSGWSAPVEFHDSLALCALNSAYSLRASSAAAANVLAGTVRFVQRQTPTVAQT